MALDIIGAGWGRTATNSLKIALENLGLGVCHHMYEVANDKDRLVPLWNDALDGAPDWNEIFDGFNAAVDWPTAGFWDVLSRAYPDARVILTTRSAESWQTSFSETILQVISNLDAVPEPARPVAEMARRAVIRSLGEDLSPAVLIDRFRAHEAAVRDTVPADRLLVFSPTEGWGPLCAFLGRPDPGIPFPRSNHRDEFFSNLDGIE